jgi:hypothetical protein
MPLFRILRLKDNAYQHFRWAPHTSGASQVRRKDYQESGQVDAESAYGAWSLLRDSSDPLRVGDLLESEQSLKICKYVSFEDAHWENPESSPAEDIREAAAGGGAGVPPAGAGTLTPTS